MVVKNIEELIEGLLGGHDPSIEKAAKILLQEKNISLVCSIEKDRDREEHPHFGYGDQKINHIRVEVSQGDEFKFVNYFVYSGPIPMRDDLPTEQLLVRIVDDKLERADRGLEFFTWGYTIDTKEWVDKTAEYSDKTYQQMSDLVGGDLRDILVGKCEEMHGCGAGGCTAYPAPGTQAVEFSQDETSPEATD